MKKPLHWTLTPAGKKKWARITKRARMARGKTRARQLHVEDEISPAVVAFACGYTEAWLDRYAQSVRVPVATLTARVGHFLHKSASR